MVHKPGTTLTIQNPRRAPNPEVAAAVEMREGLEPTLLISLVGPAHNHLQGPASLPSSSPRGDRWPLDPVLLLRSSLCRARLAPSSAPPTDFHGCFLDQTQGQQGRGHPEPGGDPMDAPAFLRSLEH